MRALMMIALSLVVTGCKRPKAGVSLARSGDGYVMAVYDCETQQQIVPVWDMALSTVGTNGSIGAPVCELRLRQSAAGDIFKTWRYGDELPDYAMSGCKDLAPGAYDLWVNARPSPMRVRLEITGDGAVRMPDEGCKK